MAFTDGNIGLTFGLFQVSDGAASANWPPRRFERRRAHCGQGGGEGRRHAGLAARVLSLTVDSQQGAGMRVYADEQALGNARGVNDATPNTQTHFAFRY